MAKQSEEAQREMFRQRCSDFFDAADTDGEGSLSRFELCKVCQSAGCKKEVEEMVAWFDELDTNDDDKISKQEFLTALSKPPASEITEANLRDAFKKLDTDGSGYIDSTDLNRIAEEYGTTIDIDCDIDDDGRIYFEEFLEALRAQAQ